MTVQEELKLFAEFNGAEWLQGMEIYHDMHEYYVRWFADNNQSHYRTAQGFPALLAIQGAAARMLCPHHIAVFRLRMRHKWFLKNIKGEQMLAGELFDSYSEALVAAIREVKERGSILP